MYEKPSSWKGPTFKIQEIFKKFINQCLKNLLPSQQGEPSAQPASLGFVFLVKM